MRDKNLMPERVTLPGTTDEEQRRIEAVREESEWYARTKSGFLSALFRKGRPFMGVERPARKPTKHQRHKATVAVRSAYLKAVADA